MSDIAIQVEDLGKLYRLGEVGTGTISHDLNRWMARIRGKEDPFAKIGESNDRTKKGDSDYVWALKDVGFTVKQGEVLGIIGRNGAGKSTLLKLLSKVTQPNTGRIKVKGRIASLLEVGTGFHPELTGRENIFLNGAIMGMTKNEIRSKFDEIVEFAGVERYVDTPVKRYSSGMYVRLAFAVAAHLEPEILIVDEVLAVGDAEFQKKCLGKMKDVSTNGGRTVLFVSHNMVAMQNLCDTGLYLKHGQKVLYSSIFETVNLYQSEGALSTEVKIFDHKDVYVSGFQIVSEGGVESAVTFKPAAFKVEIESKREIDNVLIGFGINDAQGTRLFTLFSKHVDHKYRLKKGNNKFECLVANIPVKPGIYTVEIYVGDGSTIFDYYNHGLSFEILPSVDLPHSLIPDESQGALILTQNWQ